MSGTEAIEAVAQIAYLATRARRLELQAAFVQRFGRTVQSGPFAGMVLPDRAGWGDGDTLPKLLGSYEAELHAVIADLVEARPSLVVNVGAAEGFYAVGLARLLPGAMVHAFEISDAAAEICRDAARLNDVESRVSVAGTCTPTLLQHLLIRAANPLLVCDCEGCERELIDPRLVPALASTTIVVECHDFMDASITQTMVDRLNPSHELIGIREGARDPNVVPFLQSLGSLDRWLAVCEYRPCTMHWLIARPKSIASGP
jgi:hypothetical protein